MIPRRQEPGQVGAAAVGARLFVGLEEIDEVESVVSRDRCHGNLPTPRNLRGCSPRSAGAPVTKPARPNSICRILIGAKALTTRPCGPLAAPVSGSEEPFLQQH